MNKRKIKRFIKGNSSLLGWLFIYTFIEIAIAAILFAFYLTNSVAFQEDFLNIFDFIQTSESLSNAEFSLKMTEAMLKLTDIIILPIIGLSAIALMGLLAIKCRIKKEKVVKKISKEDVLKYMLIGSALNLSITIVLNMIPDKYMQLYSEQVSMSIGGNIWMAILVAGVLGPIAEEIVFRHFQFEACKPIGIKYAVIGTALMFGIAHGNLIQGSYAFILGLIFAVVDYKEDNLLPSIIIHITINLSSVLIAHNWTNEIAGLVAYFCMILAVNILVNRNKEENWLNETLNRLRFKKINAV